MKIVYILINCCLIWGFFSCTTPEIAPKQEIVATPPLPERPSHRSTYIQPMMEQIVERDTKMKAMQMATDMAENRYCNCINNSEFSNNDFINKKMIALCEETSDKEMEELIDMQVTYRYKKVMREAYEEVKANCKKVR